MNARDNGTTEGVGEGAQTSLQQMETEQKTQENEAELEEQIRLREELPKSLIIISDMQFDSRLSSYHWNESLFDSISRDFISAGYKMPKICFWNLYACNVETIPMQKNELGLILCSGFSINNLKMFMSGDIDPYKILLDIINEM